MISNVDNTGSRRKSLDADINLVPFIDLLSMCICFLLMTAVWIQLASMQVKQSHGTEATDTKGLVDLLLQFKNPTEVTIKTKKDGKALGSHEIAIQNLDGFLSDLVAKNSIGTAMMTPHASIIYGDMIKVMDVFRKNKIFNIGIAPVPRGVR